MLKTPRNDDLMLSPSVQETSQFNSMMQSALSIRLANAMSRHNETQTSWLSTIQKLKKKRSTEQLAQSSASRSPKSSRHRLKSQISLLEAQQNFGYNDRGVKRPSIYWKPRADIKHKEIRADLQNRTNAFYQGVRESDVAYITT